MKLLDRVRRYGTSIVLAGIGALLLGVGGWSFEENVDVELSLSESTAVGPYEVVFDRYKDGGNPRYDWMSVVLEVKRDGRTLGVVAPEQRIDRASGKTTSKTRSYTTFLEDLYFVFGGITGSGAATVQITRRPLASFLGLGVVTLALGVTGVATRMPRRPWKRQRVMPPPLVLECRSCRKTLPESSRFCYLCGLPVTSPSLPT